MDAAIVMFSANEARDAIESQVWKASSEEAITGMNALVEAGIRVIETGIKTKTSAQKSEYGYSIVVPETTLEKHFPRFEITYKDAEKIRSQVAGRITNILHKHGYRVFKDKTIHSHQNAFKVIWSTQRARELWGGLVIRLRTRVMLKRYIRSRLDEWLAPPNGRLYLKADVEFKNQL